MKNYNSPTVQEYLEQKQELKQKKNQIILQMRQEGYSLQAIGDKFNCSREWIRKILKKEFQITGPTIKFIPENEVKEDEYIANDISKLTGYSVEYLAKMTRDGKFPEPIRKVNDKSFHLGISRWFWKKTDVDKWIEIKIKYLKISLERFLHSRLHGYEVTHFGRKYRCAYSFNHSEVQKRYKLLVQLQSGKWEGKLMHKMNNCDLVIKEFYNLIKSANYVATDYSKYLNKKSTKDYAKEGLYNHMKTAKILDIADATIKRYRKIGVLKEGEHYFAGNHYHHRYMYDPKKTKKAILEAGFNLKLAQSLKDSKRGNK